MSSPLQFSSKQIQDQCFINYFISKYDKKIGYVSTKNLLSSKYCIIICPGLSGYAIPFIEWFFELYNDNTALISFDYRGFGLSNYESDVNTVYEGINIDTMAIDMYNLFSLLKLHKKKCFILGHSYGVLVGYNFLNNYDLKNIIGFIQIDESLMNVPQTHASDTSYPSNSTFDWNIVKKWVDKYESYSKKSGYYLVKEALLEQFKVPGFASSKDQLNEWLKYTNNINGNVLALAFKDSIMSDYAFMVDSVFIKKNIPMFIYVGLGSIVPSNTQLWIYNKVKKNKSSMLLKISANNGGSHTPFLPFSKARIKLFKNIHKYISNIINRKTKNNKTKKNKTKNNKTKKSM